MIHTPINTSGHTGKLRMQSAITLRYYTVVESIQLRMQAAIKIRHIFKVECMSSGTGD